MHVCSVILFWQTIDLAAPRRAFQMPHHSVRRIGGTHMGWVVTVACHCRIPLCTEYANNPKTDFLNWALINAGTFDYAGDAWGYSYGAAAEWNQGRFTLRGGVFDMSATPAGGVA